MPHQKRKVNKAQPTMYATIQKRTNLQMISPEGELRHLVARGDWELVLKSSAFEERSCEGKAQTFREAIDNRIHQLGISLNHMVNGGPEHRAAAIGVLQRKQQLERIRDEVTKNFYKQVPATLPQKTGAKIDFY